ncbi:spore protease [Bacillus phage G]|uniref:Gp219 n=1 Tax=Bacillus phage G TaxID=2884420 RepID=G3M9W0_9CAUD|nr:spore protease [Bacillus phage G]AEO93478.1 gp219 [Bacillus phage G]
MGEKVYKNLRCNIEVAKRLDELIPSNIMIDDIIFICIGTDRNTGDSLGPFVGTYLNAIGYTNVIGTIDEPLHALNLEEIVQKIPKDKYIIAIDSCVSQIEELLHSVTVKNTPVRPGSAVNKKLPSVGDVSILVNVCYCPKELRELASSVLASVRLSHIIQLSKSVVKSISKVFPLEGHSYGEVASSEK